MVLKSTRLIKLKPMKRRNGARGILAGGVTALIGLALFSETAAALRRI